MIDERIEIQPGGRVVGQIVMEKEGLVVAPGGVFEGAIEYVRRGDTEDSSTPTDRRRGRRLNS